MKHLGGTMHPDTSLPNDKPWHNPKNRAEIEVALATHMLFCHVSGTKYWELRRNGKTQTWKTRPDDFSIPVKYGFKGYAQIEHTTDLSKLRIARTRKDAEAVS